MILNLLCKLFTTAMIPKKTFLVVLFSAITFTVFSQTVTKTFVDYYDKPADRTTASFYIETFKTNDTAVYWQRKKYYNDTVPAALAATGKSKDAEGLIKEGAFVYYYKNGIKEKEGNYSNNLKEGEWKEWNEQGKLSVLNHFKKNKMVGKNIRWFSSGSAYDSTMLDDSGNGKSFGFYEDGAKEGEGNYTAGDKNGLWIYYYRTAKNKKSIEVNYEMDSAMSYTCYTEAGEIQTKDCFFEREAVFSGGDAGWIKYLIKKLTDKSKIYTRHLKKGEAYTAIVKFVVDKEGNTTAIKVENPRNEKVDELAVKIIENSPKWIPAIQYNRKVSAYRRQPITFQVSEE